jgi:predicted O-methyltransferase YrrM
MNNILGNHNFDEFNNIKINKRLNELNTSHNYSLFNKIIILISLFIILNFVFIIKNFFLSKNRDLIINKIIEIESENNFQINGVNLYNPPLEETDLYILNRILKKNSNYIELTFDEQKFFNGLLRKIKPKKIIEIGVSSGGSANLILNAIKDIEGAKLYSIDISKTVYKNPSKEVGFAVKENFPELMNKWTLFKGGVTSEFIEQIGGNIELAFIDTAHVTPGEKLDWLQVLPFLKEEAIVVLHDTFLMYFPKVSKKREHFSNIHLLTYIRGELLYYLYNKAIKCP